MSDPSVPPSTQPSNPNVFHDGRTTWIRNPDGLWVPAPPEDPLYVFHTHFDITLDSDIIAAASAASLRTRRLNTSHRRGRAAVYKANPDLIRHDGQVRYHSSDDEEEKENWNPSSSSHSRHSSLHQDNSFSLHDDDTLIDYWNLSSTSSHVAEAPCAPAATVDGASNNGVDNT
ncbi:hypothetical protein B0H19DRAFT_1260291 [Mycena capillaripes]|nr:hypothetical protein B0H19DRAFT_1260291 [Mycena capillaripes]